MTEPFEPLAGADDTAIAIVGMAARVPGALTPGQYWRNLVGGVESIVPRSEEQLREAGVSREAMLRPGYVRAAAPLERMEWFDAEFFGFSPKDAAIMDPQHRQFLETCWEALEDAAHTPDSFEGAIGVFAGSGMAAYFAFNLLTNPELVDDVGMFLLRHTGNDKDFLVTRASYLLDLQGPAINVQTACSTSLVATHLAVQHLLSGECDMALAGGVTIEIPHGRGYQYVPDEILSPDGHCRAFDHRAGGTVFGSGAGVVVLRRLGDALADGDHVYAIIRGTAVNNDGARKVGYLAPSIDGQAACIAEALAVADVPASTVQYVECHGTGTAMGDPIEVAALTQAFTPPADGRPYCGIGSVKSNIGHLDTAAGVASLIKATLALHHRAIPPSLHFERPNPNIAFEGSPFHVNAELREWQVPAGTPRRAGVNSLGVGGTNAFAVLEEAPPQRAVPPTSGPQLLALSARNRAALDDATQRLARHLREHPHLDLGDVAHTLHVGRKAFGERRVLAATSTAEAADLLERVDARRVFTHTAGSSQPPVVFLLPGGGAQYPRMAADLYATESVFRHHVDEGITRAAAYHGLDLRPLLFPTDDAAATAAEAALEHASVQLPCLFVIEHALAQLLFSWGVQPAAMLGHSVGENVAACLAGTMSFADCLGLVALRGRLMDRTRGGMLAVPLPVDELAPLLQRFGLDLAVINAPDLCVASGTDDALAALHAHLTEMGVEAQRVRIHIAAHSRLLDPVLPEFRSFLQSIALAPPTIPWVSNTTGTWVTDAQATDPEYWVQQLRNPVQFSTAIASIAATWPDAAFVEVGPGRMLSSLARANPSFTGRHTAVHSMHHPDEAVADDVVLLTTLGRLWAAGHRFPTAQAFRHGPRPRLSLPTYAFQAQRYFIEPGAGRRAEA
ncbi:MAG: type I polyketide synthase, partial [Actinomycetota bacterium]|nr:type I polyketide synthase [Actinomycetota bacterium]